ncbi:sulfur carrier protein ThiS [Hyphomicrobium sp. CS1GBMeth3]|uniref:sulfur carrier protein ThiS n=1 Tax=Hyphomicrobium sp. CS1GBMeth3 TaxID=1892845 RepID=UPI000931E23D|nr:sulfur carrier protein ThiS [Hyphomicrobium sp. CS1GBMeth3]
MHLVVNGSDLMADVSTLSELVAALGYAGTAVATAVNGEFVAAARRDVVGLADDDLVEIVAARPGG